MRITLIFFNNVVYLIYKLNNELFKKINLFVAIVTIPIVILRMYILRSKVKTLSHQFIFDILFVSLIYIFCNINMTHKW